MKSKILRDIHQAIINLDKSKISIGDLMLFIRSKGFGLALIIFAIIPSSGIALPPLATIFAIPICLIAIQIASLKSNPSLPQYFLRKKLHTGHLLGVLHKFDSFFEFTENFLLRENRFGLTLESKIFRILLGIMTFILGVTIILPIPLTNLIPSIGCLLIGIGLLGNDILWIIIGIIIGILGLILTCVVMVYGAEAISHII